MVTAGECSAGLCEVTPTVCVLHGRLMRGEGRAQGQLGGESVEMLDVVPAGGGAC